MSVSPSDAELVEEARGGSSKAMDVLLDRYWATARAVAYQRLRRWDDAEEAAQEAFVLAFRKLGSLRSPERFGGWLFTIVQRSCVESVRRKARRPQPISEIEVMGEHEDAADAAGASDRELRSEIMSAIDELPDRYRPVVLLRYGQDMPVKEIGRTLGLPLGTVVSQMFRANRILRTRLKHLVS